MAKKNSKSKNKFSINDDKLVITLPNGIELFQNSTTKIAQDWAIDHWGIVNARVFLSKDTNGFKTYLFVVGEKPEYENTNFEAICVHIDIYAMANNYIQKQFR